MRKMLMAAMAGTLAAVGLAGAAGAEAPAAKAAARPFTLDSSFGTGGVVTKALSATEGDRYVSVAVDGKSTYASGYVTVSGDQAMAVTRFTSSGAVDTTFGTAGTASVNVAVGGKTIEQARSVVVQKNGSVVVVGQIEKDPTGTGDAARDTDIALARFKSNGTLDTSFGTSGVARIDLGVGVAASPTAFTSDLAWGLTALPNDKLFVVAGTKNPGTGRTDLDQAAILLTKDGARDPKFATNGVLIVDVNGGFESPRSGTVQPDGKLVMTGYTRDIAGVVSPYIVRFSQKGVLDKSFGTNGVANSKVLASVTESYEVGLQGKKYITAGYGTEVTGGKVDLIAVRWNANGTIDQSFGTNGYTRVDVAGDDDRARDLVVLPDGSITVVGSGKPTATELEAMVVRLSKDGALETGFGTGGKLLTNLGGPNDAFFGVALSADGASLYVAGYKGGATSVGDDAVLVKLSRSKA